MAQKTISFALMMVLVTVLWTGSTAQTDCTNTLISLSPCLSYITGNSSKPDSGCCTQLSSVVKSKPECLCQALNGGGSSLGVQVNQTQAQALPGVCNVQTPPLSTCNSASPTGSPTSSGPGSNTSPATDNGSSDGSSTKLPAPLLFFLLFVASYASTLTI